MLTATTRRCGGCGVLVLDDQSACSVCGSVPCPLVDTWPAEVPQWLTSMHMALYFRPLLAATRQQRAEFLLRSTITGHSWDGKIVKMATPPVECLPIAVVQAQRWTACGKIREAAEMIALAKVGI